MWALLWIFSRTFQLRVSLFLLTLFHLKITQLYQPRGDTCSCEDYLNCRSHFERLNETSKFFFQKQRNILLPWNIANARCQSYGFQLAEILTKEEHTEITEYMKQNMIPASWIGITDKRRHGVFSYLDGYTPIQFSRLTPGYNSTEKTSCLAIGLKSSKFKDYNWYGENCEEKLNFFCQFHHDSSCSKNPMIEVKKGVGNGDVIKIPHHDYYISRSQKNWPVAAFNCQQEKKVLIDSKTLSDKAENILAALKGYAEKSIFWINDKTDRQLYNTTKHYEDFVESKFNSVQSQNGSNSLHSKKNTIFLHLICTIVAVDYGKLPRFSVPCESPNFYLCVHPTKQKTTETIWFEGKSLKPDSTFPEGNQKLKMHSYFKYCQMKSTVEASSMECLGSFNVESKANCICFNGTIFMTEKSTCKSSLLVGPGCLKISELGAQIKLLNLNLRDTKKWVLGLIENTRYENREEWFVLRETSTRQLIGNVTFFFKGVRPYQDDFQNRLCFEEASSSKQIYSFKLPNEIGKVTRIPACGTTPLDVTGMKKISQDPINSCELVCEADKFSSEKLKERSQIEKYSNVEEKKTLKDIKKYKNVIESETIFEEEIDEYMRKQLVKYLIDQSFPDAPNGLNDNDVTPLRSFLILEAIFDICKHVCQTSVPSWFFDRVIELFRISHRGRAYEYQERFTETQTIIALGIIDKCRQNVGKIEAKIDLCTGMATEMSMRSSDNANITVPLDNAGYQKIYKHHIFEATWNVIDIWNAVCISDFRKSYLLYHLVEQEMENLFTQEILQMWHSFNLSSDFYKNILGPLEHIYLKNLQHCVKSVYIKNSKINKLLRPKIRKESARTEGFIMNDIEERNFVHCSNDQRCAS